MTETEVALTVRTAATGAVTAWRELLRISRPGQLGWTMVPFLVGGLEAQRGLSVALLVGALFVAGPLALLLHGIPSARSRRSTVPASSVWLVAGVSGVVLLLGLVGLGEARTAVALILAAGIAVADGSPAARTGDRPFIVVCTRTLIVTLVATAGLLLGGRTVVDIDWTVVVALAAWTAGSVAIGVLAGVADDPRTSSGAATHDAPAVGLHGLPARLLTWVAAAGYAASVLLLLSGGSTAVLAALGVVAYLLLPAIARSMRTDDAAAVRRAARRAWAERLPLDLLVGAWLAALLLVHWGVVRPDPWTVAVVGTMALTGYVLGNIVVVRLVTRRHGVRRPVVADGTGGADDDLSLAIVVPCLDAAVRLPGTLAAIRAQTYPDTTILVVDAGSSDGSPDEAAAWLGDDAVAIAEPAPAGWSPLDWARDTGVRSTDSDLILFVDADTVLAPIAARILVEQLEAARLDAISGRPRTVMPTMGARAGAPGFSLSWFGLFPGWSSALRYGRPAALAIADASLFLVRRDAYLTTGGLSAVPRGSLPGVGLARSMARRGFRVGTLHAASLAARPRTDSAAAAFDTWRRQTMPTVGRRIAGAIGLTLLWLGAFVAPLLLPIAAVLTDDAPGLVALSAVPLVVLLLARLTLAATQREPLLSILWHPVTAVIAIGGQLASLADHIRGRRSAGFRRARRPLTEADAA